MKEPLWQRLRRRADHDDADDAEDGDVADASPRRTGRDVLDRMHRTTPDPTEDAEDLPHLADLDLTAERRSDYADWADRMKSKRQQKLETVRATEAPGPTGPTYWSTDALFQESRRLEEENQAVLGTRAELLAVLGLPTDATDEDVVTTYRRLAKEHHPDRLPNTDPATRELHVERMQEITSAYRALQRT